MQQYYRKAEEAIAALEPSDDGWDVLNRAEVERFRAEAAAVLGHER